MNDKILKPKAAAMADHVAIGAQLFPCRAPGVMVNDKKGRKVPGAKLPKAGLKWRDYKKPPRKVVAKYGDEVNIAWALGPGDLVVDFDPRNGSDDAKVRWLERLELDGVEFGPSQIVRFNTPSGGEHWVFTKDPAIKVQRKHPDFPGMEFISEGGYVLIAGSSNGKRRYELADDSLPLTERPEAPVEMLRLVERKAADPDARGEPGDLTNEQLARALEGIDADQFACKGSYEDWLRILAAAHFASGGNGIDEAAEWSASASDFGGDGADAARGKWDTFGLDRETAAGIGTLGHYIKESGNSVADYLPIRQTDPQEAFTDAPEVEVADDGDDDSDLGERHVLNRLNRKYCYLIAGGRDVVMRLWKNPKSKRYEWLPMDSVVFKRLLANKPKLESARGPTLGDQWMNWEARKTAIGTTLDLKAPIGSIVDRRNSENSEEEEEGMLNLWTGYGIEAKPGDCSKLLAMIRDSLCDGNDTHYEYLLDWIAGKIQQPFKIPQVAVAIKGTNGTGKSFLGNILMDIFGGHGFIVTDENLIGQRFNGHFMQKAFVYVDDALTGSTKISEGQLRTMITSPRLSYETKGQTAVQAENFIGLWITVNDGWKVPTTLQDRRFFILRTSSQYSAPSGLAESHPNKRYWAALVKERENGGREAFLHEMLKRKLPADWEARAHVPLTKAHIDEIEDANDPVSYFFKIVQEGEFPVPDVRAKETKIQYEWAHEELHIKGQDLTDHFNYALDMDLKSRRLGPLLKPYGVDFGEHLRTKKGTYWKIPKLPTLRRKMKERMGLE